MDTEPVAKPGRGLPRWIPFFGRAARAPTVAVIRLAGVIAAGGRLRGSLNMAAIAPLLERAFALKRVKAVALQINSPGGAPAQTSLLFQRIRALADEKKIPVLAFIEDAAASGGYWLACAADEIYADRNSIVGSIGVIYAGFGLDQAIAKLGVERRLHTAGEKKSILDPFLPEKPDDVARLAGLQQEIHARFKELVRLRRGDRIKSDDDILFSGEFWTGQRAFDLGLIDGFGEMTSVLKARFGPDVRLRPVSAPRSVFDLVRRGEVGVADSGSSGFGTSFADGVLAAVEARLWWNRLGL